MLGIHFRTFLSLKTYVLISFVVFWNAGFLFARYLGGGGGKGAFDPIAMKTAGYVCILACIFFLLTAGSKVVQTYLVESSRSHNFRAREFYLLAFITGSLAVAWLSFAYF